MRRFKKEVSQVFREMKHHSPPFSGRQSKNFRREILKFQMEFAKFQRLDSSNGIDGVSLTLIV